MAADVDATDRKLTESSAEVSPASAEAETPGAENDSAPMDYDGGEANDAIVVEHRRRRPEVRHALILGLVGFVVLGGLAGWTGHQSYEAKRKVTERELFLQVGRQGALNLTTIDWQHADADINRILDSSTGTFHDDFASRSGPFLDVVKQAQSTTVGSITEAGLESDDDNGAQVLVSVKVDTKSVVLPEQKPRSWRMRITVVKSGDDAKVSNVEFVP